VSGVALSPVEEKIDRAAGEVKLGTEDGTPLWDVSDGERHEFAVRLFAAVRSMGHPASQAEQVLWGVGIEDYELARIERAAEEISGDPWHWLRERSRDGSVDVLRNVLRDNRPAGSVEPTALNLDAAPAPPDWIVEGLLAKRKRLMISGDQSTSKSTMVAAIIAAGLNGGTFLGRPVNARRFLLIDGEQDAEQIIEKWRPLGVRPEHLENVRVYGRGSGAKLLGTPEGNAWIAEVVESFRPDVIFLDTTGSTTSVKGLDNDAVAMLYRETLNPLIDRTGAALAYTHHERKSGGSGDRSDAALGARQWSNQADYHATLATAGRYTERPLEGEAVETRRAFVMRRPKVRGGAEDQPIRFEVRGVKDRPEGSTLNLRVTLPEREFSDAEAIAAACDGVTSRKALAEAVAWGGDGTGKRFVKALDDALDAKLIEQVGRGRYAPGEARS
jgi:hypothetical protein